MKTIVTLCALLFSFSAEAQTTLNVKFFIEGLYIGSGITHTDSAIIELHSSVSPYTVVETYNGLFSSNGIMSCSFSSAITGNSYWVAIKHRSAIETWSYSVISFSSATTYDFTTAASKSYGNNLRQLETGVWGLYNGNINQDGNIDLIDFPFLNMAINTGACGYYMSTDLNGDGNVDQIDYPILDENINSGIFSRHP